MTKSQAVILDKKLTSLNLTLLRVNTKMTDREAMEYSVDSNSFMSEENKTETKQNANTAIMMEQLNTL